MRGGSYLKVRCLSDMCCLPYDVTARELRRWGVVDCVKGWLIEPALSRQEAEAEFWEWEDAWGGGPA